MNYAKNILETIGNTPMVKINKLNPYPNANIFAKIEGTNPGGSIKDRIALRMLEQAEREGKLAKGKTIIEATSGNTGIALAMIGAVKGYVLAFFMIHGVTVMAIRAIKRPIRKGFPKIYRFWWKRKPAEVMQIAVNLAFFVLTGQLFFRAVDLVIDFHRIGFIMEICNRF